jgi:hypothetical protein
MPYPNLLAGGLTDLGRFDPFDLYAGESKIVSSQFQAVDATAIRQFAMLEMNAAGRVVEATTGKIVAIAAQPCNATTPGTWIPVYIGGVFNHEALIWPAAATTLGLRKKAVEGTPISVTQLL